MDYWQSLGAGRLRDARIGLARKWHTGYSEHTDRVLEHALEVLRQSGAMLVDDVEVPGQAQLREHFAETDDTAEALIMQYEFKAGLAKCLATRPDAAIGNLADLIRFNEDHADQELPYFGQESLVQSEARGALTDALYLRALASTTTFAHTFAALFDEQNLSALIAPTNAPAWAIDLLNGDRLLGGSA